MSSMNDLSLAFDQLPRFDLQRPNSQTYMLATCKMPDGSYASRKISFANLARELNSYVTGFKSAAYALSSQFASSDHDHDIYTSATYVSKPIATENKLTAATLVTSNANRSTIAQANVVISAIAAGDHVKVDSFEQISASLPKLGSIMFVAMINTDLCADAFDYHKSNFSGWIIANSTSSYNANDFLLSSYLSHVFDYDEQNDTFKLPLLNDFCKISNDISAGSKCNGAVGVPVHSHSFSYRPYNSDTIKQNTYSYLEFKSTEVAFIHDLSNTFDGFLYTEDAKPQYKITKSQLSPVYRLNKYPGYEGIACGANNENNRYVLLECESKLSAHYINDVSSLIKMDGDDTDIPYPTYNCMPTAIYVGPSISTDLDKFVIEIC